MGKEDDFVDPYYFGQSKINFVKDPSTGEIKAGHVNGWKPEFESTERAWEEIKEELQEAAAEVKAGKKSTLFFHMKARMLEPSILADETRFFRFRVNRHLSSQSTLESLSEKKIQRYCDALVLSREELLALPENYRDT